MRISAYICLYGTGEFLPQVIDRIYPLIDELLIVDGPYRFISQVFPGLETVAPDIRPLEILGRKLIDLPKVRYLKGIWEDEFEKRMFAYDSCDGDIVLVVDDDELWSLDQDALESFYGSSFAIATMGWTDIIRPNTALGLTRTEASILPPPERMMGKIFRKERVSSEEHLHMLWLAGLEARPRNEITDFKPLGSVVNMVGMRGEAGQFFKYLFYRAEVLKRRGGSRYILPPSIDNYAAIVEASGFDAFRSSFLRLDFDGISCPLLRPFHRISFSESIQRDLVSRTQPEMRFNHQLRQRNPLFKGEPFYFYLPQVDNQPLEVSIVCSEIDGLRVELLDVRWDDYHEQPRVIASVAPERGCYSFTVPALPAAGIFARVLGIRPHHVVGGFGWVESISID